MAAENPSNWSDNADLNTTVNGINIAEGFPPANINNAMRAIMASIKGFIVGVTAHVASTYLKRNSGNTAYETLTSAQVLSDIMSGTTASATDIVLGKRTTNPNQPAFYAVKNANQNDATGDATGVTVTYGSELNDQGGCYDGSTTFTAPVSGFYHFTAEVCYAGLASGNTYGALRLVTSNRTHDFNQLNIGAIRESNNQAMLNGSAVVYMDAGDTAHILAMVAGGTKVVDITITGNPHFSGYLVA